MKRLMLVVLFATGASLAVGAAQATEASAAPAGPQGELFTCVPLGMTSWGYMYGCSSWSGDVWLYFA